MKSFSIELVAQTFIDYKRQCVENNISMTKQLEYLIEEFLANENDNDYRKKLKKSKDKYTKSLFLKYDTNKELKKKNFTVKISNDKLHKELKLYAVTHETKIKKILKQIIYYYVEECKN